MKKIILAAASAAAALTLASCAGASADFYEINGVPYDKEGQECVSISKMKFDKEGLFDFTPTATWTREYCVETTKIDKE